MTPLFFRVRIGDDVFRSGDRRLTYLSVELSEDARSSNCRFELYDPGLAIAGKYFLASYESGGIQVPSDLVAPPQPVTAAGAIPVAAGGAGTSMNIGSGLGEWLINRSPHIPDTEKPLFWQGLQGVASKIGINPDYLAVIMVTETGYDGEIDPSAGYGGDGGCGGLIQFCSWGGAAEVGHSPTAIRAMSATQQLPLIEQYLSTKGIPSGADLATTYLSILYPAAMSIPRGQDLGVPGDQAGHLYDSSGRITKESLEAGLLEKARAGEFPGASAATPPSATPAPATPPIQDEAKTTETVVPVSTTAPTPAPASPQKGTEIIIEVGQTADNTIAYHFIHTGTNAKGRAPDTVAFTGKSIRWEMSRRTINTTWEDVTLREVAQQVCDAYGRTLEMEGDGPTYAFLDATGISYMDLLRRECRSIGYRITDNGNTLILEPYRPQFTGFVVTRNILLGCDFSDEATAESQGSVAITNSTAPNPTTPDEQAAEPVLETNPLTGKVEQANPENSTGTGEGEAAVVTGSPTPPITGIVQTPNEEPAQVGDMTEVVEQQIPDNPLPTYTGIKPEDVTGLPTQQLGTIDLADGSAMAEIIRDESRRVKGYPSTVEVILSPATLQLAPGSIIALAQNCFDNEIAREAFAKEWRCGNVKHQIYPNRQTTLEIYTPQAQKPPQSSAPAATTGIPAAPGTVAAGVTLVSGQHIWPMALEGNTSCGATCEFGYERGRLHAGIDIGGWGAGGGNSPSDDVVWASANGVATVDPLGGGTGYGTHIDIDHGDGTITRYAHLDSVTIQSGATVSQGQQIGVRGWTGMDGPHNIHLHYEIRPGGNPVDPRTLLPKPGLVNVQTGSDTNNAPQG